MASKSKELAYDKAIREEKQLERQRQKRLQELERHAAEQSRKRKKPNRLPIEEVIAKVTGDSENTADSDRPWSSPANAGADTSSKRMRNRPSDELYHPKTVKLLQSLRKTKRPQGRAPDYGPRRDTLDYPGQNTFVESMREQQEHTRLKHPYQQVLEHRAYDTGAADAKAHVDETDPRHTQLRVKSFVDLLREDQQKAGLRKRFFSLPENWPNDQPSKLKKIPWDFARRGRLQTQSSYPDVPMGIPKDVLDSIRSSGNEIDYLSPRITGKSDTDRLLEGMNWWKRKILPFPDYWRPPDVNRKGDILFNFGTDI